MDRVTPEMVVEAYRKTGLKPKPGDYCTSDGYACGIGALAIADGWQDRSWISGWVNKHPLFREDYGGGFIRGFDGRPDVDVDEVANQEFMDGYVDGTRAREAAYMEFGAP